MSTTIRIDNQVKNDLERLQMPRESYNDVVRRLLDLWLCINSLEPVLRGAVNFEKWRSKTSAEKTAFVGRGDRSVLSDVPIH